MKNAAKCLHAFAAPDSIKVYPGATQPLLRPPRYDPEIHGASGLGGVEGLPSADLEEVQARLPSDVATARAVEGMATAIRRVWNGGDGSKVVLVSSGPMTNIALFSCVYPELLEAIGERSTLLWQDEKVRGPNTLHHHPSKHVQNHPEHSLQNISYGL